MFAAANASTEVVSFAVRHTSGYLRVALPDILADRLQLEPMPTATRPINGHSESVVAVDARNGTTTGISATDRAHTIRLLASTSARSEDFTRPGHVVPVRTSRLGVLAEPDIPGAAIDLADWAALAPLGAWAELICPTRPTELADIDDGLEFASQRELAAVRVSEVLAHRLSSICHECYRERQTIGSVAQPARSPTGM